MNFIPVHAIGRMGKSTLPDQGQPSRRLPSWVKVRIRQGSDYLEIRRLMDRLRLHTICEEARCPNLWECWNDRTATFLILGDICTRRCRYCAVTTGRPLPVDLKEPGRVAKAVRTLGLRHAVITSVNRDELPDGGAAVFAETIREIRRLAPGCTVEVLIPDFAGNPKALTAVVAKQPDILNHNIETVPRLFSVVRPQGKYVRSLNLLQQAKEQGAKTKSGLIIGMGETHDEVLDVMRDLRAVSCDLLTISQYLQPTARHLPVARFYQPEEFDAFRARGSELGFRHVEAGPLVRSSYHAEQQAKQAAS